jgi:lytic murein transglycosylase
MRIAPFLAALVLGAGPAPAEVSCGGPFPQFVADLKEEAVARGHAPDTVNRFFDSVRRDPDVIAADRKQGVFTMTFTDFARRLISGYRLKTGRAKAREHDGVFDRIERDFGISRGVLLAFWAFETDYGGYQGDYNTADALVTLAHDCRRPELFRPQIFAAIELFAQGGFDPATTTGAWAGEIGMVQMLPEDILAYGTDADGDGRVALKSSAPDALVSGAKMLQGLGWRPNEPWLQEVQVPATLDWSQTGRDTPRSGAEWADLGVRPRHGQIARDLPADLLLPQGRKGPAFLAYPNFDVYFEWNKSFVYVLTAGYFANRLEGAPVFDPGNPPPRLSDGQMKTLQRKLRARGYDVGGVDGILGAGTRAAVQDIQEKLGLPADAWPTRDLLNRL